MNSSKPTIGVRLQTRKPAQVLELLAVFLIPVVFIGITQLFEDPHPFLVQAIIALAMILMMGTIWLGLHLRGQTWRHFGLTFGRCKCKQVAVAVLQSIVVFVAALAAFILGTIVVQNLVGNPQGADLSAYDSLRGNLPLLLATLASVYVTASFGEEVIYRGFLMTRLAELFGNDKAAWRLALILSSIIFGLIHYQWGVTGIVQTGFMGLALGMAYLMVRRNLWVNILAHAYMDTLLIVPLYFSSSS